MPGSNPGSGLTFNISQYFYKPHLVAQSQGTLLKPKTPILLTVCLYHGLNDGVVAIIPILLPIFRELYQLSYTQIGLITGGSLIITLIAQLIFGHAADNRSFRIMLSLGIFLISISLLLLTQATGFLTLLAFVFILRVGAAFFHPIGVGWISRTFKKERLDWAMGMQSGSADIGAFIALSTTLFLAEQQGWQFPLYVWASGGILIVLIGLGLTYAQDTPVKPKKHHKQSSSVGSSFQDATQFFRRIKLLIPAFMLSGASWGIIITYLPLLLQERTTLSLTFIGILVSVWVVIGGLASFLYGRFHARLGRKKILILSYFFIGITGLLISVSTVVPVFLVLLIILGLTVFLTYPTLFSFVSEITHESIEGRIFSYVFTLQLGGGTILVFLSGILSDILGVWIPFVLLGILGIILSILYLRYYQSSYVIDIQLDSA